MDATIRIVEALAQYTIEHDKGDWTDEWMDLLSQVGAVVQNLETVQFVDIV